MESLNIPCRTRRYVLNVGTKYGHAAPQQKIGLTVYQSGLLHHEWITCNYHWDTVTKYGYVPFYGYSTMSHIGVTKNGDVTTFGYRISTEVTCNHL